MNARPKALILDYTGVITVPLSFGSRSSSSEPSSETSSETSSSTSGADTEPDDDPMTASIRRLRALMAHELDNPDPDGLWNRLERGEAPLSELLGRVEAVTPGAGMFFASESPASLMASIAVRPDVVDRLRAWKSLGVTLALLTNNVAEWRPLWTANLVGAGGYDLFDVVIDSSMVGMRKPEAAIYHHTVDALRSVVGNDLNVADCLFVDDFPQNIVGAQNVGLPAILATHDDAHWTAIDALFR